MTKSDCQDQEQGDAGCSTPEEDKSKACDEIAAWGINNNISVKAMFRLHRECPTLMRLLDLQGM